EVIAECSHRRLKSGVLARKVFEVPHDLASPALDVRRSRHGRVSTGKQPVDARERLIDAHGLLVADLAPQSRSARPKPWPELLSVYQHTSCSQHVREKRRVVLSVTEANDVDGAADRGGEPFS